MEDTLAMTRTIRWMGYTSMDILGPVGTARKVGRVGKERRATREIG